MTKWTLVKSIEALKEGDIEINETIQSSEINPHIYGQLIFNKRAKTIQ